MGSGRGIRAILTKRACVRLTLLFALLVGGVIVNVAVAWGLAALPAHNPLEEVAFAQTPQSQMRGDWILATQRRSAGKAQNWFQFAVMDNVRVTHGGQTLTRTMYPSCGNDESGPWEIVYPIRTVTWSRLGFDEVGRVSTYMEAEIASGWPVMSMWGCMAGYDRDTGEKMHVGCVGLGQIETIEYTDSHETCLPCRPIWPGFAVNTAF